MQVKPISAVPASDSADVEYLRVLVTSVLGAQAVALALAASDMPTQRVELSSEQRIGYAVQGVARLGVAEVQAREEASRNVNMRYTELLDINGGKVGRGDPLVKALNERERQVWGCGQRRQERAVSVAWDVSGLAARLGANLDRSVA
ncbi:hypothetical protein [Micromonospora sp. DH14]|uniref:hypothetical protein n=1 Tax=Micromonospora sp. DH14 TaxID=3040120 RepID=UPI00244162CD|nr:hypothetical protein [Micromonospora sp. DH14]MDG9678825.1 hypothetical protein [Micromonospora sp. DH14]